MYAVHNLYTQIFCYATMSLRGALCIASGLSVRPFLSYLSVATELKSVESPRLTRIFLMLCMTRGPVLRSEIEVQGEKII